MELTAAYGSTFMLQPATVVKSGSTKLLAQCASTMSQRTGPAFVSNRDTPRSIHFGRAVRVPTDSTTHRVAEG
jgi:hypothetical protein